MTPDLPGIYAVELTIANEKGEVETKQVSITNVDPTIPPDPADPVYDGVALYNENCMQCHGSLTNSSKKDRSITQIDSAINGGVACMKFNHTLSCAKPNTNLQLLKIGEIKAIADALKTVP